jgi:hypothetical protein
MRIHKVDRCPIFESLLMMKQNEIGQGAISAAIGCALVTFLVGTESASQPASRQDRHEVGTLNDPLHWHLADCQRMRLEFTRMRFIMLLSSDVDGHARKWTRCGATPYPRCSIKQIPGFPSQVLKPWNWQMEGTVANCNAFAVILGCTRRYSMLNGPFLSPPVQSCCNGTKVQSKTSWTRCHMSFSFRLVFDRV